MYSKKKIVRYGWVLWLLVLATTNMVKAQIKKGTSKDISGLYVFQGVNTENLVFIANLMEGMSPEETKTAAFDENVLTEFNIDTDGDLIEDLVIQAIPRNNRMYFFGPSKPVNTGLESTILSGILIGSVDISGITEVPSITTTAKGYSLFAGPRDNPFFFDLTAYKKVILEKSTTFNNPGMDSFAGTNVMSIVVEIPKKILGTIESKTIGVWVETKIKK